MFRKLITNLSFSPSLIGEVALLAKRLKHEERLRLAGLIAVIVAVILNTVAVLYPPESANTASNADMIYGGVQSTDELLIKYDNNEANVKDIFDAFELKRSDIAQMKPATIRTQHDNFIVASRAAQASQADGQQQVVFTKESGGSGTLYLSPAKLWDTSIQLHPAGSSHAALVGTSSSLGWFAIIKNSGALAVKAVPKKLVTENTSPIALSKKVHNHTRNSSDQTTHAHASDRITYTLHAKNTDKEPAMAHFVEHIGDILEYADVIDANGGTLDLRAQTLTWPSALLEPNQQSEKQFTVRLKAHLPATARGTSNPYSYDCTLSNTFGNTVHTPVFCPPAKLVETAVSELPPASARSNYIINTILVVTALFLYARTRQQKEEVRLIRRDVNEGALL